MPIQEQNIVFVESQVMDDVPEGGGAATGNVIADGQMNNVFPDISDLDRGYGRFNLRKIAAAVRTLSTALFGGAKTFITELPVDPSVSYTVFGTSDPFDRRSDAAGRVEAYLFQASEWPGYLLENHIAGMRAIQLFQRPGAAVPDPGQTLALVFGEALQYVRATRVSSEIRQFTYSNGSDFQEYDAAVVTVEISDALRQDLPGSPPSRAFSKISGKTEVRDVLVADAARYYGATRLAAAASIGDRTCQVESIYTRLVPSSQTEIPLVDRPLAGEVQPVVASATSTVTTSRTANVAPGGKYVLPTPCWPGSLDLSIAGRAFADDGLGNVISAGVTVGQLTYSTGEILFNASAPAASGSATETYRPAAGLTQQAHTTSQAVTEATRRYNWIFSLTPLPAPGTVEIPYMAQGQWYVLRDNGQGAISGAAPGHGSGTVNYVTGTVSVTLGALPDVGSAVLCSWGTPREFVPVADLPVTVEAPALEFDLGQAAQPGTVTLEWFSGGVTKTASDNGSGVITGDATGGIFYGTGKGWLRPTALPDPGTSIVITADTGASLVFGATVGGGPSWSGTLPGGPVEPKSVTGTLQLSRTVTESSGGGAGVASLNNLAVTISDNGIGGLLLNGALLPGSSINYTTGDVVLAVNRVTQVPVAQYEKQTESSGDLSWTVEKLSGYVNEGVTEQIAAGGIAFNYRADGSAVAPSEVTVAVPALVLDLAPNMPGRFIPGSLLFKLGGQVYADRSGVLYRNIDPATGAGVAAGTVDYQAKRATLTNWTGGIPAFDMLAGLIDPAQGGQSVVTGRTASRPLKSQSLLVSATTLDGRSITGAAQADGSVTGGEVEGTVDIETGLYVLAFGQLVPDPENPAGPQVWQSTLVDASTLRYNAVAYTYLPLDADVLGIDPVRLPADGRVPIFRMGDMAHILHTASTTGTPALDGGKYKLSLGRPRIAWAKVTDANGAIVTSGYALDRAAGVVEFDNLSGLATPVTVRHTISDLRQITDVQITGHLGFSRPLTHDYAEGETLVSSCLIHGDRRARVSHVWDQQTWNNTWSDTPQGSEAVGTLDIIAHPITVTNEGAETERWVLRWLNATNVELIGQTRGLVFSGPFTADIAPINPRTRASDGTGGVPCLTIPLAANGGGWAAGNVVRINTVGAIAPFWIARAIQQSDAPLDDGADGCEIACIGNIDRP